MNYMDSVRQQAFTLILMLLVVAISYNIRCYLGWIEPIILTTGHIIKFISGTLTYLFLGPIIKFGFSAFKK